MGPLRVGKAVLLAPNPASSGAVGAVGVVHGAPHPCPGDSCLGGLQYKSWNRIFQSRAESNSLYLGEVVKLKIGLVITACHERDWF